MKQNISKAARENGLTASLAHNRIKSGWSFDDAVSIPARGYKSMKKSKAEIVWAYLLKNPLATYVEVAKETGVSYSYAYALKTKISTPREVFEAEAADNTSELFTREQRKKIMIEGFANRKAQIADFEANKSVGKTIGNAIRRWWKAA